MASRIYGFAASNRMQLDQEFCLLHRQFGPPSGQILHLRLGLSVPSRETLPPTGNRLQILVTAITRQLQVRMIAFPVAKAQLERKSRSSFRSFIRLQTLSQEEL